MTRFRAKNNVIREYVTLLKVNQIAGITSDFKMDIVKMKTDHLEIQNVVRPAFILNDLSRATVESNIFPSMAKVRIRKPRPQF